MASQSKPHRLSRGSALTKNKQKTTTKKKKNKIKKRKEEEEKEEKKDEKIKALAVCKATKVKTAF